MNRPLNFLHLTTFYPPYSFGGDAMYLYRLCHELGSAGHQVDVVHCVDSYHLLNPAGPSIEFAEHPRVRRHELRSGLGWVSPLLTQQTGRPWLKRRQIQRLLDRHSYDVIHFHNTSLLGPAALKLNAKGHRAIKMYTTHEHWLVCPMHVLWKFNRQPCDKPECLRCTLKGRRPPQIWRYTGLLDRCSKHVDQFVSPSRFTASMHRDRGFGRQVDHLPYFLPPVDDDWQDPAPRPHERPYFLFVGRLEVIKGLQTLIPLWEKITAADLLVAGTGDYESELRQLAALNNRVKFLGALPQKELGALYHHAVATIVPSITYETFGIICIESFARKTPAIVRDLGALPEVVQESGGGFVYRSDDELMECVSKLLATPALGASLGEAGYETFREKWSTEAHLKRYFGFLETNATRKFGRIPWHHAEGSAQPRSADLETMP